MQRINNLNATSYDNDREAALSINRYVYISKFLCSRTPWLFLHEAQNTTVLIFFS